MAFLYKHYGENEKEAKLLAEKEYQAVLKKFNVKAMKEWFRSWQKALYECYRLDLPCTMQRVWLRDLNAVLAPYFADIATETRPAHNSKDPDEYDVSRATHWESETLQAKMWLERSRSMHSGKIVKGFSFTATLDLGDDEAIQEAAHVAIKTRASAGLPALALSTTVLLFGVGHRAHRRPHDMPSSPEQLK